MKRIIILGLTFMLLSGFEIFAHSDYDFSIGPYLSAKGGINGVNTPSGRKNGVAINTVPDFGITGYYPLSRTSNLGISLDIGYSTYSYLIKVSSLDKEFTHTYSYITLSPNFAFEFLLIGFNFGFPVKANYGPEIDIDKLDAISEFRIAVNIPLLKDETGSLNIFIQAGYMLTGIYDDFENDDPLIDEGVIPRQPNRLTNEHNPRAASLLIGLNYLFNLSF